MCIDTIDGTKVVGTNINIVNVNKDITMWQIIKNVIDVTTLVVCVGAELIVEMNGEIAR